MKAVVVALGKIGLPIAVQLANTGHEVVGCDVDPEVVAKVNRGEAPFPGEPGISDGFTGVRATTDTAAAVAEGADLVICVPPLVVDAQGTPDWRALDAVTADVARGLRGGEVVAYETTVPVGTTRGRLAPALGDRDDVHVVFSPERVSSGRVLRDLATYPKLVGGLTPEGEARAVELYRAFLPDAEVRAMGSAEAAELTKLVETTYRDVNIALANEFARHADALGVPIGPVIDAANSQPYSHVHRPGVAVGGHCIPVYPRFYLAGDPGARLPQVSREVNETMPSYAADLLGDVAGKTVHVLGIAYRGGVKETAFSGAFPLRDELERRGATVVASDPLYTDDELRAHGFTPYAGTADAAVVQADHPEYRELTRGDLPALVVDGRGVLDPAVGATRIGG